MAKIRQQLIWSLLPGPQMRENERKMDRWLRGGRSSAEDAQTIEFIVEI